jgi:hypothetical protein
MVPEKSRLLSALSYNEIAGDRDESIAPLLLYTRMFITSILIVFSYYSQYPSKSTINVMTPVVVTAPTFFATIWINSPGNTTIGALSKSLSTPCPSVPSAAAAAYDSNPRTLRTGALLVAVVVVARETALCPNAREYAYMTGVALPARTVVTAHFILHPVIYRDLPGAALVPSGTWYDDTIPSVLTARVGRAEN